jgi:acetyl-CoA C-acetyltransferase
MSSVYIVGGEQTDFQRNWVKEGKTFVAVMREAIEDTFGAVNIDFSEVAHLHRQRRVASFVANFAGELYFHQGHLGAFMTEVDPVFYGVPSMRYEAACASGSAALDAASSKIRSGDIDLAVVVGVEVMKTVGSEVGGDILGAAAYYEREARGVAYPFPSLFGQLADILLESCDVEESRFMDALAEIARINYENAKANPRAQTRKWFMSKEHAALRNDSQNPSVSQRLSVSDSSQITDGAACLILCSKKYASDYAARQSVSLSSIPVLKGWGITTAPITLEDKLLSAKDSAYVLPWTKAAIDAAYDRAGLSIGDMDFIETHDCFTSSEYAAISCFGITDPGQEFTAIESGDISRKGSIPVNPSGGLIGVGHPVGASGVRMMVDLWKQVCGNAGGYQVNGAKNGAMLNIGGSATTNAAFIIGR